jgi:hypothetical protein
MPTIALTSLVTPPSGVIVYWALVGISTPGIFLFGLIALLIAAIATFDLLAGRHFARALRAGDPRSGRTSIRALFGALPLATLLATILCALAAMLLGFLSDLSGVSASVFAIAILIATTTLLVVIVVQRLRQPRATPWRLFFASAGAALLLVGGVGVLFLLILFSSLQSSFAHATSASYAGQRYHLAREDSLLEHPTWHLYRCDALGLLCEEIDAYGQHATLHRQLLQEDFATDSLTAYAEDGHLLFTYPHLLIEPPHWLTALR